MMLALKKELPIYIASQPINFRCGIDGLSSHIATQLQESPQESVYIFYNRNKDKLKLLYWDTNGFILLYKRLERGRFKLLFDLEKKTCLLMPHQLEWLLAGLDWQLMSNCNPLLFKNYA